MLFYKSIYYIICAFKLISFSSTLVWTIQKYRKEKLTKVSHFKDMRLRYWKIVIKLNASQVFNSLFHWSAWSRSASPFRPLFELSVEGFNWILTITNIQLMGLIKASFIVTNVSAANIMEPITATSLWWSFFYSGIVPISLVPQVVMCFIGYLKGRAYLRRAGITFEDTIVMKYIRTKIYEVFKKILVYNQTIGPIFIGLSSSAGWMIIRRVKRYVEYKGGLKGNGTKKSLSWTSMLHLNYILGVLCFVDSALPAVDHYLEENKQESKWYNSLKELYYIVSDSDIEEAKKDGWIIVTLQDIMQSLVLHPLIFLNIYLLHLTDFPIIDLDDRYERLGKMKSCV